MTQLMQTIPVTAPYEIKRNRKKAMIYIAVHNNLHASQEVIQKRQDAEYVQAVADGLSGVDFSVSAHE